MPKNSKGEFKRYMYHTPGMVVSYDIWAWNKEDAKQRLRYGKKRLPNGFQIWKA